MNRLSQKGLIVKQLSTLQHAQIVAGRESVELAQQLCAGKEVECLFTCAADYLLSDPGSERLRCSSALTVSGNTLLAMP